MDPIQIEFSQEELTILQDVCKAALEPESSGLPGNSQLVQWTKQPQFRTAYTKIEQAVGVTGRSHGVGGRPSGS